MIKFSEPANVGFAQAESDRKFLKVDGCTDRVQKPVFQGYQIFGITHRYLPNGDRTAPRGNEVFNAQVGNG